MWILCVTKLLKPNLQIKLAAAPPEDCAHSLIKVPLLVIIIGGVLNEDDLKTDKKENL